jgi:hypothetical protein
VLFCDNVNGLSRRLGVTPGRPGADGAVSLDTTSCAGLCDQGPAPRRRVVGARGRALGARPAGLAGVAQPHPDLARKGILLRKFGQEAIRVTAGKRVHGTGSVPGGMNKQVSGEDRVLLQQEVTQRHSMQPRRGLLV